MRLLLLSILLSVGCSGPRDVTPTYDPKTHELVRLDYDYDHNGTTDVRTFMAHGKPVRLEGDTNQDLVLDRWEYYDENGSLTKLGASTANDGVEDSWIYTSGPDTRIEVATRRDGRIDRREFYTAGALVRTERDTDRDGRMDAWELFDHGVLRQLLLDDAHVGHPTRRLTYDADGTVRLEVDPDGDGTFSPEPGVR